jgi:hypothetical protein
MILRIAGAQLYTSGQYVEAMITFARAHGSDLPEPTLRANAYRQYMDSCGRNGLANNAFYDEANGIRFVVTCPGLLLDTHDYGASGQDLLDAALLTIGHELGHAIDPSVYPDAYSKMASCYRTITGSEQVWYPDIADEIAADHWGATVMAEALRTRRGGPPPPEQVARVIGYASNAMVDEWGDDHKHPPASFRVNQTIGRHPALNEMLSCPAPGGPNPTCTLRGIAPEGWSR